MRDFDKRFNDADRQFNSMFSMFKFVFVIAFVMLIAWWTFIGYGAYVAFSTISNSNPGEAGQVIGKFLKGIEDGKK